MNPQPTLFEGERRPLLLPRLAPGMRIGYHSFKWLVTTRGVERSALAEDLLRPRVGTVVNESEFLYHGEPGTLPDHATPVRFDGAAYVTWFRTSCLDVSDDAPASECITVHHNVNPDGSAQPEFALEGAGV